MPVDIDRLRKTLRESSPASVLEDEIKAHKREIADALKKGDSYVIHNKQGGDFRITPADKIKDRD